MVIVFDLDDTLYEELTYVKSGFWQVSLFINKNYGIKQKIFYEVLLAELEQGRGKIFDNALKHFSIYTKSITNKCVQVYRQHFPNISLNEDADDCLTRLKNYPLYIVTDGNKLVQYNKIKALGLENRVKKVFITHRYGLKHSKPSPYCFLKICELEKKSPGNVLYIGDNPTKDFVGIKPLGFKTIRILQGHYNKIRLASECEASLQIASLYEISDNMIYRLRP